MKSIFSPSLCFFVLILSIFSMMNAEEFPKYKIVDLGVLGSDYSEAIAINEKNQVLGVISEKGKGYVFLWDQSSGLKLIDIPADRERLLLNNNGNIAGTYECDSRDRSFIWYNTVGYINIGSLGNGDAYITGLNDRNQIIGRSSVTVNGKKEYHAFVWEGEMKDLTVLFQQNVPGKWIEIQAVTINNLGHIVLLATQQNEIDKKRVVKSFLFKDGNFLMIMPEKSHLDDIRIFHIDDKENMILSTNRTYFFNPKENIQAYISDSSRYKTKILNEFPTEVDSLPGKMKKDINGLSYISPGIWISKLLVGEFPFYDVGNRQTTRISDQNSKGYVVGTINTYYSSFHAFLAYPQ